MTWLEVLLIAAVGTIVAGASGYFLIHAQAARNVVESGKTTPARLVITGSSTMAPLVKAMGKRFQTMHPELEIDVQTGGSARGLADVREGRATIGMYGRAMTDAERDVFGVPIARDGVCLVVHQSNPVKELTRTQIADIYTGKLRNWREVGGPDMTIVVIARTEGRSQHELFMNYFKLDEKLVRPHSTVGDNKECVKALLEHADAIAYLSIGEGERNAKGGVPIKLLPMAGVAATTQNVRLGRFPISRPLTLIIRERPEGLVKAFVDFALSPQATDLIWEQNLVPYFD
ncbi:MAG TPA: phosphate ABC transporter substrate-binding protein [Tepidisphaeraceae bacterium]|nr:phosphate ABC transporter substrate-binding protein [Tepidisphaeraceae bacterium]